MRSTPGAAAVRTRSTIGTRRRREPEEKRVTDLTANGTTPRLPAHGVSFGEALRVWLRVAALSFGGPAGQIAVMHRIIVDEKKWVGESRFLHALSYCMLLPGPEAQQLAIYIGWLMHRWPGAIAAGGLFVVPGIVSIMVLSWIYALYGQVPIVAALFFGLKAAVLAIVLFAVYRVGSRALKSGAMIAVAALAFVAIFFSHVPFPLIVLAAGVIGFVGARAGSAAFVVGGGHGPSGAAAAGESRLGEDLPEHARPTVGRALRVSAIWLALWLGPVVAILAGLRRRRALAGITAAVVGVILNLAIWFALHTIFRETAPLRWHGLGFDMPILASVNPWAFILSLAAIVAIFRFKAGTIQTLAACSAAGVLLYLVALATP